MKHLASGEALAACMVTISRAAIHEHGAGDKAPTAETHCQLGRDPPDRLLLEAQEASPRSQTAWQVRT